MADIEFTCPKCGSHRIEEIMVNIITVSEISISEEAADETGPGGIFHRYGEQTNDDSNGGYVDRYQCGGCGHTILDEYTQDGLDERALAVRLKELALLTPRRGDPVSFADIVHRLADGLERTSGEELVEIWNEQYPSTPIVYEGDSLFWIDE